MRFRIYDYQQKIHAIIDLRKMPVENVRELDRLNKLERQIMSQLRAGEINLKAAEAHARFSNNLN